MRKVLTVMAVVVIVAIVGPVAAQWIPLPGDPGLWPYGDGPVPPPVPPLNTYRLASCVGWNPLEGEVQIYSVGGNRLADIPGGPGGGLYNGNRQSRFSIYSPTFNSWVSADGTTPGGLVGYNNGGGALDPTVGQGTGYVVDRGAYFNAFVYVFGGYPRWGGRMDRYDIVNNTWTSVAKGDDDGLYNNGGGSIVGTSFWKVEVAGELMEYDLLTDTFVDYDLITVGYQGKPIPGLVNPQIFAAAATIGNKLYIVDTDAAAGALYEIDPIAGTVVAKASTPTPVREAGSVVWNGRLYLFGGRTGAANTTATTLIQVYDPVGNAWYNTTVALPSARSGFLAEVVGDTLYIGNGLDNNAAPGVLNDLWTINMNQIQLIPEPGTLAVVGLGLLSLLGLRRGKK